jgi:hypothetical protein
MCPSEGSWPPPLRPSLSSRGWPILPFGAVTDTATPNMYVKRNRYGKSARPRRSCLSWAARPALPARAG